MSFVSDTFLHINHPGGALINGHGFCFHFVTDQEGLAGKHEVREMRADRGVVDIWINRCEIHRERRLKFHWVAPKDLPSRVFCKVMLSRQEDDDSKLAMTGFMVCRNCDGRSLKQMFSTTPGTKGIPAPRWARYISCIDSSNILATVTISFYTIKPHTADKTFSVFGYNNVQQYTSEFIEPSRWCRHLMNPYRADFIVKFRFRVEVPCDPPEKPPRDEISSNRHSARKKRNCPHRHDSDGSDLDDVIDLISSDKDDDEVSVSRPRGCVNELAGLRDELSRLNQRELILQRRLAVEGKKMKERIKMKKDKIKQMEKFLLG